MTPEPDGGMYGERGVKIFVREYGKPTGDDTLYFTGTHRADCRNEKTGRTLEVRGFNPTRKIIEDVGGAVEYCDHLCVTPHSLFDELAEGNLYKSKLRCDTALLIKNYS